MKNYISDKCYDLAFIHIFFYRQQFLKGHGELLKQLSQTLVLTNYNIHISGFGQSLGMISEFGELEEIGIHSVCIDISYNSMKEITRMVQNGDMPAKQIWRNHDNITRLSCYYSEEDRGLNICASNGCNERCTFCTETITQGCWRPFDTVEVVSTIKKGIDRYNPLWIKFNDLNFLGYNSIEENRRYLTRFSKIYRQICGGERPVKLATRVDKVDMGMIETLKKMGIRHIFKKDYSGNKYESFVELAGCKRA